MEHGDLTEKVIGCAMTVHRALGPGFLESVYQKALAHELNKAGFRVECERAIDVTYDGIVVGSFSADMLIEGLVLVENKAVQTLVPAHEVQLVNYLTATGIDIGLLLNFGSQPPGVQAQDTYLSTKADRNYRMAGNQMKRSDVHVNFDRIYRMNRIRKKLLNRPVPIL